MHTCCGLWVSLSLSTFSGGVRCARVQRYARSEKKREREKRVKHKVKREEKNSHTSAHKSSKQLMPARSTHVYEVRVVRRHTTHTVRMCGFRCNLIREKLLTKIEKSETAKAKLTRTTHTPFATCHTPQKSSDDHDTQPPFCNRATDRCMHK